MTERMWFVAAGGTQQGPFSESVFRSDIAAGRVTPDTLVWTDGMPDWQRAADIPGLMPRASRPPVVPVSAPPVSSGDAGPGQAVSADFGVWSLFGRTLLYVFGLLLVIPAPWAATGFYRWLIPHLRIPRRGSASFTGRVGDIWYVFVALGLCGYGGASGVDYLPILLILVQAFLSWMVIRWLVANISLEGAEPRLSFVGSVWTYMGFYLLLMVSMVTIIGWAWVVTAWTRWICRNVAGTRREIVFNASGLQVLWRTLVFSIAAAFLIPLPWVLRWYIGWYVQQFTLVERTA